MSRYECMDIQEQNKIELIDSKKIIVQKKTSTGPNVSSSLIYICLNNFKCYIRHIFLVLG